MLRSNIVAVAVVLAIFASCAEGTATLDFSAETPVATGAVVATRLHLLATNGDGTVGSGSVTLKASNGAQLDSSVMLDKFGTAVADLSCDTAIEACGMASVLVEGTWTVKGKPVTGALTVNLRPTAAAGGGTGSGGGGGSTGGGAVDYSDAGCPVFIMAGMPGVVQMPVRIDTSDGSRFTLYNSYGGVSPSDFRNFQPGRGVLIEILRPPNFNETLGWDVFLIHSAPNIIGQFMLGNYTPSFDGDGTGTRIKGVDTTCPGFAGDMYDVKELTIGPDGGVAHIAAELWAHCPDPIMVNPPSQARGYICF